MNKVSFTDLNELEKVEEEEYEQWKWEMESDRDAAEKAKEQDDWEELTFSSEEILRREHILDLLEDGCFDADAVLISKDRKAIKIIGIHTDGGGNKRKAELWAWLKNVDEKELEEVETAGDALQFAWEHYEIDYVESDRDSIEERARKEEAYMYIMTVEFRGKQYKNEEGKAIVKKYVIKTEKAYMLDELEDNEQLNEKLREICKHMLNQYNKEVTYKILNIVEASCISIQ